MATKYGTVNPVHCSQNMDYYILGGHISYDGYKITVISPHLLQGVNRGICETLLAKFRETGLKQGFFCSFFNEIYILEDIRTHR